MTSQTHVSNISNTVRSGDVMRSGHTWNVHQYRVPASMTIEQLLKPATWIHVAHKIVINDTIECKAEDGSFIATLNVLGKGKTHVAVEVIHHYERRKAVKENYDVPEGYEVKHGGRSGKWRVIRKSDGVIIESKIDTEAQAAQYARDLVNPSKAA